jgi:hypothetical protein
MKLGHVTIYLGNVYMVAKTGLQDQTARFYVQRIVYQMKEAWIYVMKLQSNVYLDVKMDFMAQTAQEDVLM